MKTRSDILTDTLIAHEVEIPLDDVLLPGLLSLPCDCIGLVLFAHGSGSSRHSTRNRFVASQLQRAGIGTLLFDLLTGDEAGVRSNVFDIDLLAERLGGAARWAQDADETSGLAIAYFGASTGAAAALVAAAGNPNVSAVVSRGGRPDLADDALKQVRAPTLLIVGGDDLQVLQLNQQAFAHLTCKKDLAIVPGATHLFEEPGTLEQVATLAAKWFERFLPESGGRP